ncbi:MAG TPA: DegT/DnrJ/EryC1/StrS family aminotransferase [Planctomycetota bacterium]|jgi:perosamine synthetase|nr:DegT/DnrJ/EryC1/StrS family aminotransferase [Planctomycetota bacterium]
MSQAAVQISLPSDQNATGRSFGAEELEILRKVIESGTLNCTKGTVVREFEQQFARLIHSPFCRTTTSGTASIHAAIAAIDPEPGDEVISSPITDMGAITPILYQTAIPVFADVDPETYNVTAESIERKITRRTRAVVVTHLFGNPCDMDPILALAKQRNFAVIEDCAQAYCSEYRGRPLGTIGAVGCFSLQQGKHMTTGEGGMVVTSDDALARRLRLFIDKAWGYGDPNPDHYFLAMNYRMTELQGAVALAQLAKLEEMTRQRVEMADLLSERILGVPGVRPPKVTPGGKHVYWKYPLRIDPKKIRGGADAFGAKLKQAGIFCAPRYIQKLAFECQVLRDRNTFGKSKFPYVGEHRKGDAPVVYDVNDTPGAVEALAGVVVLPWNEKYLPEHVEFIAASIRKAAAELTQ